MTEPRSSLRRPPRTRRPCSRALRSPPADRGGPSVPTTPLPAARIAVALLAAALLLPASSSPAAAQASGTPDRPPLPGDAGDVGDGRIDGFWGFPWGADSARIVERMGPPLSVSDAGDGGRFFAFTPLFLGRDGYLYLRLAGDRGLVGGSWEPMTSDCTDMMRRLVRTLKRAHPGVPPRTRGDLRGGLTRDLCVAAMEDSVRLEVRWEDDVGNRLRVVSTPERPALRMLGAAGEPGGETDGEGEAGDEGG